MKKLYALIALLLIVSRLNAQIPNPSFENWNTTNYFDLVSWNTGNFDAVRDLGVIPVTQINGQTGFGVKMLTIMATGGLAEAFITNGDPFQGDGGVPCGPNPTAITGYYRYNVQPADSAIMLVAFKSGGSIVSTNVYYITGIQNTFTAFSYPISLLGTVDSVIFAAASSNLIDQSGITPGSFLELDGVALAGTSVAIPNGAFENWTNISYDDLIGWNGGGDIQKTSDSYIGTYAVKLTTTADNGSNINPASISSGQQGNFGPSGGAPYTLLADTITGYYKLNAINDSATFYVSLNKNGLLVGGSYRALYPTPNYTYFEMAISAFQTPDTIRIDANSSVYPLTPTALGSTLYLDNLRLKSQGTVGIFNTQNNKNTLTYFYPNPVGDEGTIQLQKPLSGEVRLCIYDVAGRKVLEEYFNNTGRYIPLNVSSLNAGIYHYEISCGNKRMQNKFVKH